MTNYVSLIRVSTQKQGKSKLGLEFQKMKIKEFLKEDDVLVKEYVEIKSGYSNKREILNECIKFCKRNNYTLLIYRLCRLSRRVSFISKIMEENLSFKVVEFPNSTPFQLHLYSVIGEEERRRISQNTKNSLRICKLKGIELGKNGKYVLSKLNKQNSIRYSNKFRDLFERLNDEGNTYSSISRYLNSNGYKSYRNSKFYPKTIQNMFVYLDLKLKKC